MTNEWLGTIIVLALLLPLLAYFVAKYAAIGFMRGRYWHENWEHKQLRKLIKRWEELKREQERT